jgi:hypothetical protein
LNLAVVGSATPACRPRALCALRFDRAAASRYQGPGLSLSASTIFFLGGTSASARHGAPAGDQPAAMPASWRIRPVQASRDWCSCRVVARESMAQLSENPQEKNMKQRAIALVTGGTPASARPLLWAEAGRALALVEDWVGRSALAMHADLSCEERVGTALPALKRIRPLRADRRDSRNSGGLLAANALGSRRSNSGIKRWRAEPDKAFCCAALSAYSCLQQGGSSADILVSWSRRQRSNASHYS